MIATWSRLRHVAEQQRFLRSLARFRVLACGRRSGKSDLGTRWIVRGALAETDVPNALFGCCAPTREQARDLFWRRTSPTSIWRLIPPELVSKKEEATLSVELVNGSRIWVFGVDEPARAEGRAFRRLLLDEMQKMHPDAWPVSLRPTLSTEGNLGSAVICGRPLGRNHFFDLYEFARGEKLVGGEWDAFTWKSDEVLAPAEIAAARHELDPLTFAQEYEASFLDLAGRAYLFERSVHAAERLDYQSGRPLDFCFDFNVRPGTASVVQPQVHPRLGDVDAVIGEVWIPDNSTTEKVCRRLIADWGPGGSRADHAGKDVYVYGDPTGGARGTAKVAGSDCATVERMLRPVFRVVMRVARKAGQERPRINTLNARLRATDGTVRTLICPYWCPWTVKDFEGTIVLEGGSGELDKDHDPMRTHLTDGLSYRALEKYPLAASGGWTSSRLGI